VSLYDAEGRDVAIETVDNGNNTFDVAFVPESEGQITAKVFFDDVEIPDSPFVVDVQPRQPDQQSTLHRPDFGWYHHCLAMFGCLWVVTVRLSQL